MMFVIGKKHEIYFPSFQIDELRWDLNLSRVRNQTRAVKHTEDGFLPHATSTSKRMLPLKIGG